MKRIIVVGGLLIACAVIAAGAAWRTRRAEPPEQVAMQAADRAAVRPGAASGASAGDAGDTARGTASAPPVAEAGAPPETARAEVGPEGPAAAVARALPWLHNFAAAAVSAEASAQVVERMARWRVPDPDCSAAAYGGLAVAADVAPAPGSEEVLASYTQGVLVLDAAGRVIASAPAPRCQGSGGGERRGDALDAVARQAGGEPLEVRMRVADQHVLQAAVEQAQDLGRHVGRDADRRGRARPARARPGWGPRSRSIDSGSDELCDALDAHSYTPADCDRFYRTVAAIAALVARQGVVR
jgi:hypothetical protein